MKLFCFLAIAVALVAVGTTTATMANRDPNFPQYHVRPADAWINDPNAPFRDPKSGILHLFCQYNDYHNSHVWGNMSMFHFTTKDYVSWQRIGVALQRGKDTASGGSPTPYDEGGVFSGSATLIDGAEPRILYTCCDKDMTERQCMAYPADPSSDPLLKEWKKFAGNPVIKDPPAGAVGPIDFRDPTTGFPATDTVPNTNVPLPVPKQQQGWLVALGTSLKTSAKNGGQIGSVVLYRWSDDFTSAKFESVLFQPAHVANPMVEECPALDSLPNPEAAAAAGQRAVFLKTSNQLWFRDFYRLGSYNSQSKQFSPNGGGKYLVDRGIAYASKTFWDPLVEHGNGNNNKKGGMVLFTWINEAKGKTVSPAPTWAGAQSLPRLVTFAANYGGSGGRLRTEPLPALEKLRGPALPLSIKGGASFPGSSSAAGTCHEIRAADQAQGNNNNNWRQTEIVLDLTTPTSVFDHQQTSSTPSKNQGFEIRLLGYGGNKNYVSLKLYTAGAQDTVLLNNTDFTGSDIRDVPATGTSEAAQIESCRQACLADSICTSFTFVRAGYPGLPPYDYSPRCSLKMYASPMPPPPYPLSPCCVSANVRRPTFVLDSTKSGSQQTAAALSEQTMYNTLGLANNFTTASSTVTNRVRVFVDGSVLEVYLNDGIDVISSRVYLPAGTAATGVQLCPFFDEGAITVEKAAVYPIKSIW